MMARRLLSALFASAALWLAPLPAADQPAAEVIYPRAARTAETADGPRAPGSNNSTVLIGFALLAAAAGAWLLWRQRRSPSGSGEPQRRLAIAESKPLGNRQYLVVADYDGRKFLLGVCPGRIEMLTPLGEDDDTYREER